MTILRSIIAYGRLFVSDVVVFVNQPSSPQRHQAQRKGARPPALSFRGGDEESRKSGIFQKSGNSGLLLFSRNETTKPRSYCGGLRGLPILHCRAPAGLKQLRCVEVAKHLYQAGHEAGPSGLMAGAQASSIVAVEVFVEEDVIAPVRIGLEL